MITINVRATKSYYTKTNSKTWKDACQYVFEECAKWCESECRKRAPVVTGTLRDHHSFKFGDMESEVRNNCGYASCVAFGTSKQKAQNYPLAIVKDMQTQKLPTSLHKKYLKKKGVIQ